VFALTLAGGNAYATLQLAVGDSVTTSNGYTISVVSCNGSTSATACPNGDSFALSANGEGVTLTGTGADTGGTPNNHSSAGVFESATTGSVDTFIVFAINSPIQSTSVGISATGCGYLVSGCSTSLTGAQATATVSANTAVTSGVFSGTSLGPSAGVTQSIGSPGSQTSPISITDAFGSSVAANTTFYVEVNLNAISGSSYAAFDSITLTVPEPATWTVFALGLAGLGMLRRRRQLG